MHTVAQGVLTEQRAEDALVSGFEVGFDLLECCLQIPHRVQLAQCLLLCADTFHSLGRVCSVERAS